MCASRGGCASSVLCASQGVVCFLGGVLPGGWEVSQHALRQIPLVNRMTDRCKKITFATSLRTIISPAKLLTQSWQI